MLPRCVSSREVHKPRNSDCSGNRRPGWTASLLEPDFRNLRDVICRYMQANSQAPIPLYSPVSHIDNAALPPGAVHKSEFDLEDHTESFFNHPVVLPVVELMGRDVYFDDINEASYHSKDGPQISSLTARNAS